MFVDFTESAHNAVVERVIEIPKPNNMEEFARKVFSNKSQYGLEVKWLQNLIPLLEGMPNSNTRYVYTGKETDKVYSQLGQRDGVIDESVDQDRAHKLYPLPLPDLPVKSGHIQIIIIVCSMHIFKKRVGLILRE